MHIRPNVHENKIRQPDSRFCFRCISIEKYYDLSLISTVVLVSELPGSTHYQHEEYSILHAFYEYTLNR